MSFFEIAVLFGIGWVLLSLAYIGKVLVGINDHLFKISHILASRYS